MSTGEPCTASSSATICCSFAASASATGREDRRQLGVGLLRGQLLRPVQREVEVAAAVVDRAERAARRLVVLEERAGRGIQRVGQHLRLDVAGEVREVLERGGEREELAERVPAQVVLARRAAARASGADPPAPVSNRPPPASSGTIESIFALRADLEDREQVGDVVAQHVAGHRDGVLALAQPVERVLGRRGRARGSRS